VYQSIGHSTVTTWSCTYDPRTNSWGRPKRFHDDKLFHIYPLIEPQTSSSGLSATSSVYQSYDRVAMVMNLSCNVRHCVYIHDMHTQVTTPLHIPYPVHPNYEIDRIMFVPPSTLVIMDGDYGRWNIIDITRYDEMKAEKQKYDYDNHLNIWLHLPPLPHSLLLKGSNNNNTSSSGSANNDDDNNAGGDEDEAPDQRNAHRVIGTVVC
jgi:hypothetical protein